MVEAELALELLFVVQLDLPAHPCQAGELPGVGRSGQVGQPVVGRLLGAFWPFRDQPFLAGCGLLRVGPLANTRTPVVRGADTHEGESGLHRLAVWPVTEADGLQAPLSEAGNERADRLRVAVRPRTQVMPACLARVGGHFEGGLGREHSRLGRDRQHVLESRGVQLLAQLGVIAIGAVTQHRCFLNVPARRLLNQLDGQLRLGLELNLMRDLRLAPALRIRTPLLWQIQSPAQRHRPLPTDSVQRHADLAVAGLPQPPGVLALDPRRVLAVLRKPCAIDHPCLHIDRRRHPLRDRLHHERRIPRAVRQELLHRVIRPPRPTARPRAQATYADPAPKAPADTTRR